MKVFALALTLGVAGFAVLYSALIAGEALSTTSVVMDWRASTQIPVTLLAAIIYLPIAVPVAYALGKVLIRWAPTVARSSIAIAALLITTAVVTLQLGLYDDTVLGRSIIKVAFCVVPLLVALYWSRRDAV